MQELSAVERAQRVLHTLADLSPSSEQQTTRLTVPTEWFRWLDASAVSLFSVSMVAANGFPQQLEPSPQSLRSASIDRDLGERLAAIDQIRPGQRSIRVGWLWLVGRAPDDKGRMRRVFAPLLTRPVRIVRPVVLGDAILLPAGDVEISDLISDLAVARKLEAEIRTGGGALEAVRQPGVPAALLARLTTLKAYARDLATAAGYPTNDLVPATDGPDRLMKADGVSIVAGVGVYAVHETSTTSRAGSLRTWAEGSLKEWTAFHSMYVGVPETADRGERPDPVQSPVPLTVAQRSAVVESRVAPITLVSGAPGTGKSHTIVAIANDALSRGESVLVSARADATVDALLDLFQRSPGPDPIVFGSNERREELASRLAAGQLAPVAPEVLDRSRRAQSEAWEARASIERSILDRLTAETLSLGELGAHGRVLGEAPGLFDDGVDLDAAGRKLAELAQTSEGWWTRWRRGRADQSWRTSMRVEADVPVEAIERALQVARAVRAKAHLDAEGGLEIGKDWDRLACADDEAREATAKWLAAESRSRDRLSSSTLPAIATLATALRSGRGARRQQLSRLDDRLTHALPLWVGSLPDIDDLLPAVCGLFDLVIVDEASSVDQPMAVPALLRGKRGVIVGDPQQLRHVSFLSDQQMQTAIEWNQLQDDPLLAARLDVRRNSAFDAAAGVAPVLTLDEHFRSDPHLVDFLADQLYGGAVKVATRRPSTQERDCIDVVRLDGQRDDDGVVGAEVDWCIQRLRELRRQKRTGVGVVTPFRAQADALEAAVLAAFSADDLEALDLRVGTVHAFQGNERDSIIAPLGLGSEATGNSWRFVEDSHLFAVFVSRARRHMTVVTSGDAPPGGLVDEYLAQAESPPGLPAGVDAADAWVTHIARELRTAGVGVTVSYPCGRHSLDIVVDNADIAIECRVHPDGADAHVGRHLELRRAGWTILEAYPSRWEHRAGEIVVELLAKLRAQ